MTPWFVIQVRPSAERKVAEALKEHGVATYVPLEHFLLRNRYATHKRSRALVRGYVFATIREDLFPLVHDIDGAIGVYMNNGKALQANPWQLLRLWIAEESGAFDHTRPRVRRTFRKGEKVMMTSGDFKGRIGTITKLKGDKRASVVLEAVSWPVTTEFEQMESVEPASENGKVAA